VLVLLHPSSGYGRMWEWTVRHLGSRCHVYALDQRGHGDSARPDGDYSAEEFPSRDAACATCPVAILRGTRSSELTMEEAKEIARCWKNAAVVDVEGDYALQMENPAGLAQALLSLAGPA
jgi:pimeloyl-ACP methyl ester carboxylesterase